MMQGEDHRQKREGEMAKCQESIGIWSIHCSRKWLDKKESQSFAPHHLFICAVTSHFDVEFALTILRHAIMNSNKAGR